MSLSVDDPRAIPVWLYLLRHPDWWTKCCAIECLGKHGTGREDVVNGLIAMLADPELSMAAAAALGAIADPRAANHLFQLFQKAQGEVEDQVEILDAMAGVGTKVPQMGPWMAQLANNTGFDLRLREKARRLVGRLQGDAARDAIPKIVAVPKPVDLAATPEPKLVDFLADLAARGGSDFHLATGFQPHRRIHGMLEPVDAPPISAERAEKLLREVLNEGEWQKFMKDRQLDICLKVEGLGRFRANFFSQRAGLDASFRAIPQNLPILEELGLPESAWEVTHYTQGLVLVTGPAGCGKSTTLAALVNKINETRAGHIITVEDPIEFVHPNKECLVNQRQVPHQTVSFARALKAALRQDPDVIMVGELRDLETIALAISASETGHLVFGTLSTTTATATIDRVINSFPAGQQAQIRSMISESLKAVISQALLPRIGGYGRVAAFEILRGTPAVSSIVREGKTYQLPSMLQTGQLSGMNTMDQALLKLVEEGKISPEVAMDRALKKEPFEKLLQEERLAFA
jgi:twitching motility protein PilT